MTDLSMR